MGRPRVYDCDHSFFSEIDSESKAYWLGFISADGCVTSRKEIQIGLQARDVDHLHSFRTAVSASYPVTTGVNSAGRAFCRITLNSARMTADLERLGVVQRKSLVLQPATIRADLRRHYWRGVVDGDGSIGKYRASIGRLQWRLSVTGTKPLLEALRAFLSDQCGTRSTVQPGHGRSFALSVMGNQMATAAIRVLYENASIALSRKLARAAESMALLPAHPKHLFRGKLMSLPRVADELGMKAHTLIQRIERGWSFERATSTPPRPHGVQTVVVSLPQRSPVSPQVPEAG